MPQRPALRGPPRKMRRINVDDTDDGSEVSEGSDYDPRGESENDVHEQRARRDIVGEVKPQALTAHRDVGRFLMPEFKLT